MRRMSVRHGDSRLHTEPPLPGKAERRVRKVLRGRKRGLTVAEIQDALQTDGLAVDRKDLEVWLSRRALDEKDEIRAVGSRFTIPSTRVRS